MARASYQKIPNMRLGKKPKAVVQPVSVQPTERKRKRLPAVRLVHPSPVVFEPKVRERKPILHPKY